MEVVRPQVGRVPLRSRARRGRQRPWLGGRERRRRQSARDYRCGRYLTHISATP